MSRPKNVPLGEHLYHWTMAGWSRFLPLEKTKTRPLGGAILPPCKILYVRGKLPQQVSYFYILLY